MNGPEVVAKSGPGAAPAVAPKPVAAPVATTPDPAIELKSQQEAFAQAQRVADIKMKRQADKLRSERETEKKTWGEKLSKMERFEKLQANAKLNPEPFLKEIFGDNYYEMMTEHRLNGGTPPAQIVAAELAKMEEKFNGELSKRDAAAQKEREERAAESEKATAAQTSQQVVGFIHDFWKANAKEYPAIEAEGHSPERIAQMIAGEVRKQFDASTVLDAEGNIVKQGTANPKGVADAWEASLLSRAKRINALPKYAAEVPKSAAQPLRRTLSNDLTGSTAAEKPIPVSRTRDEALKAATEARQRYMDSKAQR